MDEYKESMNRILPSESFISETEALMKKIRDENETKEINEQTKENIKTGDISIDFAANDRTARIKKWTIGLSSMAAALVCIFAISSSNSADVKEGMVTDSYSGEISVETAAETETEIVTAAETTVTESAYETTFPETSAVTLPPENRDEDENPQAEKSEKSHDRDEKIKSDSAPEGRGADGANSMGGENFTEPPAPAADESPESTISVYAVDERVTFTVSGEISEETTSGSNGLMDYQPPVYVDYSWQDEEEIVDEETVGDYSGYFYSDHYEEAPETNAPIMLLSASEENFYMDADAVYVPDSISEMNEGEYFLTVEAGFDSYSGNDSGLLVGAVSEEIHDDTESSDIISTIAAVSEDCQSAFSENEQTMNNYRYSVKVCSSDKNEGEEILFEIRYDKNTLMINRYDNGTVSSEIYYLEEDDYEALNSLFEKML